MSKPETKDAGGFYRYMDADGQLHIVDDLDAIPAAFRAKAEKVESKGSRDLFSFVDEEGHTLIADSLEAIPKKYRDFANNISTDEAKKTLKAFEKKAVRAKNKGLVRAKDAQREIGDVVPFVNDLDIPSMLFGFALALGVGLVLSLVRRTGRTIAKVAMLLLVVALVAGSYFAWIRRTAGLGDNKLVSPTTMIDDAREAADAMKKKLEKQRAILKQLEESER